MFVDRDWSVELEDVQVQEIDGTWRDATVYRHKYNRDHVCIYFGDQEYEGIDRPYSYTSSIEELLDPDGETIKWRVCEEVSDDEEYLDD